MYGLRNSPPRKILRTLLLALLATAGIATANAKTDDLEPLLRRLDKALDDKESFVEARKSRIAMLEEMLAKKECSDEQFYQINMQLYREYESFRFDETLGCLNQNLDVARRLHSQDKIDEIQIMLALLYANSGMYFEANDIFAHSLDTTLLTPQRRTQYYLARRKLCYELGRYAKNPQAAELARQQNRYYTERLLAETDDSESFALRLFRISHFIDARCFDKAERLILESIGGYPDTSHNYAILAYNMGVICDQTGRHDEMAEWYARSAYADIHSATKDNAALCSLANQLFGREDVKRAFRYIRESMDDAIFYNAKLRPWQIAMTMPHIERAATDLELSRMRQTRTYSIIISVLLLALASVCVYLLTLYRQMHRDQRTLHERSRQIDAQNSELSELNKTIIEANSIKEEYIGLFISICSEYIDRLIESQRNVRRKLSAGKVAELQKEVSSLSTVEEETKRFYKIFDTTFLSLYPTFVEDFNSLLEDSEHIEPHKGELLNTELRIFALIRLGINDSSRIASLLRYSVNTIYNYRAKVKNKAKHDRDDFEERVKHIGSFRIER